MDTKQLVTIVLAAILLTAAIGLIIPSTAKSGMGFYDTAKDLLDRFFDRDKVVVVPGDFNEELIPESGLFTDTEFEIIKIHYDNDTRECTSRTRESGMVADFLDTTLIDQQVSYEYFNIEKDEIGWQVTHIILRMNIGRPLPALPTYERTQYDELLPIISNSEIIGTLTLDEEIYVKDEEQNVWFYQQQGDVMWCKINSNSRTIGNDEVVKKIKIYFAEETELFEEE